MSQLRLVLFLAGLAVVFVLAGCRNPFLPFKSPAPATPAVTPAVPTPAPSPRPATDADGPAAVVTAYLTALQDSRYQTAYDLLSRDSQRAHTRAQFEEVGKQGMPRYDLSGPTATMTGDKAEVSVKFVEETGSGGFTLVREDGAWKVAYRGGRPGQPYPE